MINYYSTVLFVKDIEQAKDFYINVLERKIEHDFGTNISFYGGLSIWQISSDHIIPQKVSDISTPSNRIELYFETTDILEVEKKLNQNKIEFLHALHEEPWGQKTVRFYDIDHHLIEIGETLATFVGRMHSEGLSTEGIEKQTGIPLKTINELLVNKTN